MDSDLVVSMICGTGKTLMEFALASHQQRACVFTPTIELVAQHLKDWEKLGVSFRDFKILVVSMEADQTKNMDLEVRKRVYQSCNVGDLTKYLKQPHEKLLIISTYQSAARLMTAMIQSETQLDAAIFDECQEAYKWMWNDGTLYKSKNQPQDKSMPIEALQPLVAKYFGRRFYFSATPPDQMFRQIPLASELTYMEARRLGIVSEFYTVMYVVNADPNWTVQEKAVAQHEALFASMADERIRRFLRSFVFARKHGDKKKDRSKGVMSKEFKLFPMMNLRRGWLMQSNHSFRMKTSRQS